ncbi:MAG: hypothetical protein KC680_04020 [Candidatus Peregrinibacteria bacterium]|nr:hypothetical protein [Candidatus Peregrinibacteria bacterium]MCB9807861.1 hypothetical protein [Candidatus Peribacteria bacterium]
MATQLSSLPESEVTEELDAATTLHLALHPIEARLRSIGISVDSPETGNTTVAPIVDSHTDEALQDSPVRTDIDPRIGQLLRDALIRTNGDPSTWE